MKITKLETIHVKPRWLFLKVHTDEGVIGLGEPIVEGRTQTTEAAVREIGRYLIGQDPRRIEHHWQAIYRGSFYRGGPVLTSALSGVEQALWDITGKWLGVPVWQLLALAACLQVDACVPNFLCQEQVNLGDGYLKEPFKIVDGYVPLPTRPGLGIELDDAAVADKVFAGDWETPWLRHPDGSVADW